MSLSLIEMLIIGIALLLFVGPDKLPIVIRQFVKWFITLRKAADSVKTEVKEIYRQEFQPIQDKIKSEVEDEFQDVPNPKDLLDTVKKPIQQLENSISKKIEELKKLDEPQGLEIQENSLEHDLEHAEHDPHDPHDDHDDLHANHDAIHDDLHHPTAISQDSTEHSPELSESKDPPGDHELSTKEKPSNTAEADNTVEKPPQPDTDLSETNEKI